MSRIVGNSVSQPTQTPLRRATEEPISKKIIEEPISLTKEQLTIYSDPELTRLQEAVVRISCGIPGIKIPIFSGSAVIISPDGLAVTNKHVAEALFGYEGLTVKVTQPTDFSSGSYDRKEIISLIDIFKKKPNINQNFLIQRLSSLPKDKNLSRKLNTEFHIEKDKRVDTNEFTAELLKIDPNSDLALIRINKNNPEDSFSFVSFEEGEVTLRAGDESYTLGHPFGTNFNVLRRGEVLKPIDDLSRSIIQARGLLTSGTISGLNSKQEFQLDECRDPLFTSLLQLAKRYGASLAVNCFLACGDSGGLQANPQGQLRGINTSRIRLEPNQLATLGLRARNLSKLRMLSLAVPAQRVLDLIANAGVNINTLLRGQDVGVNKMKKVKPPKSSKTEIISKLGTYDTSSNHAIV